ncbi:mast cell protease 1A [Microcaecilia unicolor]|uniref:Mast cell protease 1A-like n=1 Tax=Microcaecilia unicolor TaxID=1415580 RepID=A0A6P7Z9Q8_9AMPH|nr:mast cell protease 1A-like [Microcaecilia unicolor]
MLIPSFWKLTGHMQKMRLSFMFLLSLAPLCAAKAQVLRQNIIGGKEAKPHSKPWLAYITFSQNNKIQLCSGFLVTEDFVMTAAHCMGKNMTAHLGVHNLNEDKSTWQIFSLKEFKTLHYNPGTKENDIMLLKLHGHAKLSKSVQLLPLPKKDSVVPVNTICNVAGWGGSYVLQEVNVEVISNPECSKLMNQTKITESMMCAGTKRDNKDASRGDSGGPLVCHGEAHGIVSFGLPTHPPGVYTRISKFMQWVKHIIDN